VATQNDVEIVVGWHGWRSANGKGAKRKAAQGR